MVFRISAAVGEGPGRQANAFIAAATISSIESTSVPSRSNRIVGAGARDILSVGNTNPGWTKARGRVPATELAEMVSQMTGHEIGGEIARRREGD